MSLSEYLRKIQNLPLINRKIIFWLIIIIFGLIMCSLYLMSIKNRIKTFPIEKSLQDLNFPDLKKEVEKMPKTGMGKEIENIKGDIKEAEKMIEENKGQK